MQNSARQFIFFPALALAVGLITLICLLQYETSSYIAKKII
jgi:hypothetical protein